MNYGHLELRIEELLQEKGISKNMICKELDIPRSNFNRYCRNEFQRLDANLICKLCNYFECEIGELPLLIVLPLNMVSAVGKISRRLPAESTRILLPFPRRFGVTFSGFLIFKTKPSGSAQNASIFRTV